MRSAAFLCISAAVLALSASRSFAESDYYIELGNDMPAQQAQQEWHTLSVKYKSWLGHLHYYPKKILQGGTSVGTRIQAGPIAGRESAEKICNHMFAHDVPCFVIEGLSNEPPPTTVVSLSEQSEEEQEGGALPWRAEAAAAPETSAPVVLPWLAEKHPVPANAEAKVEVAEAVRVPLTQSVIKNTPVDIRPLPELRTSPPASEHEAGGGWLHVEAFPDEDMAMAFWQGIRSTVPDEAKNLRVRIAKPLLADYEAETSLNIGPFASRSDADAFCHDGVLAVNPTLHCHFGSESETRTAQVIEPRYAHGDAYAARRQAAREHHAVRPENIAAPTVAHKIYWVEVVSAPSQMEALNRWDELRHSHADLLEGKRSSISASLPDKASYVVRVGPMTNDGDAINLCSALKNQGVSCRVLLYSNM